MDVHIDTIAIDFLNNSGCFFVICLIQLPLGLLWELHSQDMKIRSVLYFRCLDYNDISQKGYQRNYDSQLKEISMSRRIMYTENSLGLRSKKSINMFFKNIKRWDIIKMFNKNIPGGNCIREETIHVSV